MTPKEQKAYNLIGIAKKAGKVIGGTDMVADRIREKRNAVKAVLISSDASENTLKKIISVCTCPDTRARVISRNTILPR